MSDLLEWAAQARALRDAGIDKVESNNSTWVSTARSYAVKLAFQNGEVTADDVRKVFGESPDHPNAWGAVFRSPSLKWTGRMKPSIRVSRHAGMQRIWEYKTTEVSQ